MFASSLHNISFYLFGTFWDQTFPKIWPKKFVGTCWNQSLTINSKRQHPTRQLQVRRLSFHRPFRPTAPVPRCCRQRGVAPAARASNEGGAQLAVGHGEGNGWKGVQHQVAILNAHVVSCEFHISQIKKFRNKTIKPKTSKTFKNKVLERFCCSSSICLIPLSSHWKAIDDLLRTVGLTCL